MCVGFDFELVVKVCVELIVRAELLRDRHREILVEFVMMIDGCELV